MAEQSPYHRKIELQSPDDLQFLISNIRRAADAEIERSLPSLPGVTDGERGEDDMRVVVERLVGEYIAKVLHTTSQNITINGLPPSAALLAEIMQSDYSKDRQGKTLEEFERFDERTDAKTRVLMDEEDRLVEELAKLRRAVPGRVAEREKAEYKVGVEGDESVMGGVG